MLGIIFFCLGSFLIRSFFRFPDISERYYRDRFWPDAERVKTVLGPGKLHSYFLLDLRYTICHYNFFFFRSRYRDNFVSRALLSLFVWKNTGML